MEFHIKKILGLAFISSFLRAALLPVSAFAADKGMVLALSCAPCHGTNGTTGFNSRVQGRSAEYIEKAMLQFKAGERPATVMNRIAKGYTDEEIKLLSVYLGNQSASKYLELHMKKLTRREFGRIVERGVLV